MATSSSSPADHMTHVGVSDGIAALVDLRERLLKAAAGLSELVDRAKAEEMNLARWRLVGKYEGVKFALSYVEEALR